jgi:hypothetical protein
MGSFPGSLPQPYGIRISRALVEDSRQSLGACDIVVDVGMLNAVILLVPLHQLYVPVIVGAGAILDLDHLAQTPCSSLEKDFCTRLPLLLLPDHPFYRHHPPPRI